VNVVRDSTFEPDDWVRVTDGPFKNLIGVVYEVDETRRKVRLRISFFGRPTPIEVRTSQIEKVKGRDA
jgi:transcriptional antiterminator NusG